MRDSYDVRASQLKGYLREFYVKPDMNPSIWASAKACMANKNISTFGLKFSDDLSMKRFSLAVLLSSGVQFNWLHVNSYYAVQENLSDTGRTLSEYSDYDIVFITHERGTMRNSIMGQTINTLAIMRGPKKTFFFDMGGPTLADLNFQVVYLSQLMAHGQSLANDGDNL